jgi:hypothetical protein
MRRHRPISPRVSHRIAVRTSEEQDKTNEGEEQCREQIERNENGRVDEERRRGLACVSGAEEVDTQTVPCEAPHLEEGVKAPDCLETGTKGILWTCVHGASQQVSDHELQNSSYGLHHQPPVQQLSTRIREQESEEERDTRYKEKTERGHEADDSNEALSEAFSEPATRGRATKGRRGGERMQ